MSRTTMLATTNNLVVFISIAVQVGVQNLLYKMLSNGLNIVQSPPILYLAHGMQSQVCLVISWYVDAEKASFLL